MTTYLAILDLAMPQMDGIQLCEALRRLSCLDGTRFIALSGYGQEELRRRADAAGFILYLLKPVDPENLALTLRGLKRSKVPLTLPRPEAPTL